MPKRDINSVPDRINIERIEDYRTHWIGRTESGLQFVGIPECTVRHLPDGGYQHRNYAALHLFDSGGAYLRSRIEFMGPWADESTQRGQDEKSLELLERWLEELGPHEFCDVEVGLFRAECDGEKFALESSLEEDEDGHDDVRVTLWPSDIVFYPPWDGTYDT